MTVAQLLGDLRALDIQLTLDNDRLRVNAPAGVLTDGLRRELQERKEEIVEFLRSATQLASQQRAVVPLEPRGTRVPIFAVAGHNGDVFCYRSLTQHLGKDQPFFGLQPPGLEEGTEPLATVEGLAGYFADQIRELQPDGPMTIAGFCAGGTIAFELARQLSASGTTIRNLILFGAPYATSYRPLQQLFARFLNIARRTQHSVRAMMKPMTSSSAGQERHSADRGQAPQSEQEEAATDAVMIRRIAVERATVAAIQKYNPKVLAGHIDLLLPSEAWVHSPDVPLRWSRLATSSANCIGPAGCEGDTMLRPEYAATFAAMVEAIQAQRLPEERT